MPKAQSSPTVKAARLLDLVPFISTHQGISISELAEVFSIAQDELLDDLNTLWMCGLPGYTPLELIDLSFESGYVSIRNAEVLQRVRLLTKEELVVILIGLDLLKESISTERADLALLIVELQRKVRAIVGSVAAASPIVDSAHRALIVRAQRERRDIEIDYHSLIRDEISQRTVTPLELLEDHGFEVLVAYCHKVAAFRTFRLDNIRTLALGRETSTTPTLASPNSKQYEIKFHITKRARTTKERFRIELEEGANNQDLFTARSFSNDWLLRNAMSTLGSTNIVSPTQLLSDLRERVLRTNLLYQDPAFTR